MFRFILTTAILFALASTVQAGGSHKNGYGHAPENQLRGRSVGHPGEMSDVKEISNIVMTETDEGDVVFEPDRLSVKTGTTVRFVVRNSGSLRHEFYLDNHLGVLEHKAEMDEDPSSTHKEPNLIHVDPGDRNEIIWTFTTSGEFEFACLIPGHYEDGMSGRIKVIDGNG